MRKFLIAALLVMGVGACHAQNGYLHGNGNPSTLIPAPNCAASRFYIDDSTGKMYQAAQGSPCSWSDASPSTSAAIPTSGMLADYHFQDGTGSEVSDSSQNHNVATFCSSGGCTAPTWVATGLKFGDEAGNNKTAGVALPASLNATQTYLFVVYHNPIQKALLPFNYGLLITNTSTSQFNILSSYVNTNGNFEGAYSVSTFVNAQTNNYARDTYSGLHAIAFVCGSGGASVDRMYIDGVEVTYGRAQGSSCGTQTSGNLYLGNSGQTPWGAEGELNGTMYRATFWQTKLDSAQIYQASLAELAEVQSRGIAPKPAPDKIVPVPTFYAIGDSITFGQGVTTPWPSLVSVTNLPTLNIENWGVSGVSALTASISEPNRIAPKCNAASVISPVAIVFLGTNDFGANNTYQDGKSVWGYLSSEVSILKKAGCKVFVGTMLSRAGNGVNGLTDDANKNSLDAQITAGWKTAGADGIVDFAASPSLGADGASLNNTYFQGGGVHPNQTGENLLASIASNSLNYYYSTYGPGNPRVITAAATLASGDVFSTIGTLTGATLVTLPDCTGPTGGTYTIVNPQSAQVVTVQGGASQPINGQTTALTVPSNSTVKLTIGANPKSTSGCFWTM